MIRAGCATGTYEKAPAEAGAGVLTLEAASLRLGRLLVIDTAL